MVIQFAIAVFCEVFLGFRSVVTSYRGLTCSTETYRLKATNQLEIQVGPTWFTARYVKKKNSVTVLKVHGRPCRDPK